MSTTDYNAPTLAGVSEKDERCFLRAVELMQQLEQIGREQLGGRAATFGLWRHPRALILCDLRLKLFRCPAYGLPLDEWLYRYFAEWANFRVLPRDLAEQPSPRQQSYRREHEVEGEPLYFDEAAYRAYELRAERRGYMQGDDDLVEFEES